jgi:hypothetical protein
MGGNALKSFNTVRQTTAEVNSHYNKMVNTGLLSCRMSMIPSYRNKESHGDLDILIDGNIATSLLEQLIQEVSLVYSESVPISSSGSARSLGLRLTDDSIFQVDFIHVQPEIFDFALGYFSYNDCGNLIGVTAHKTGLKFGHQGLQYVVRDDTHQIGIIDVDLDFESSLQFLGFDYDVWKNGFDDLIDIFNFVTDATYFNKSYYSFENRNHAGKTRDRKRPTYNSFLKHIDNLELPLKPIFSKTTWFKKIIDHYPHVKVEYDALMAKHNRAKELSKKFNGVLVSEITGLTGKELGQFMMIVKSQHTDFKSFIEQTTEDNIVKHILEKYNETI